MPHKKQKLFSNGLEYEILYFFKQDEFKKVFKALRKDPSTGLNQEVLVKVFSKPQAYEEFKSLSQVASPYCVRLLGFESFGGDQALILESIKGVSLYRLLSHYRLRNEESFYLLNSIYKALKDLRRYNLSHGDLSLHNVLVDEEAQIKLIDFGGGNYEKAQLGTVPFTAPEVKKGFRPGLSSDLYSLGVIAEFFNQPGLLENLKNSPQSTKDLERVFLDLSKNPLLSSDPAERHFKEREVMDLPEVLKSLSIKVKELLDEMELRHCQTIKKFSASSFRWLSLMRNTVAGLALLFLVGNHSYTPAFGLLKIYTHKWFFVQNPVGSSYTPLSLLLKEGWHEIQWKNESSKGEKKVFVPKEKVLVLNDNFFQK